MILARAEGKNINSGKLIENRADQISEHDKVHAFFNPALKRSRQSEGMSTIYVTK